MYRKSQLERYEASITDEAAKDAFGALISTFKFDKDGVCSSVELDEMLTGPILGPLRDDFQRRFLEFTTAEDFQYPQN